MPEPRLLHRYISSSFVNSNYTIYESWSVVSLYNQALFCPECGSIWCRDEACFDAEFNQPTDKPWIVNTRSCPRHGAGTVITWFNAQLPEYVHKPILVHDFLELSKGVKYA